MKTKAPISGITPSHDTKTDDIFLHPTYLRAIKAAGGLPLVLPLEADEEDIRALLLLCSGFLFSGGWQLNQNGTYEVRTFINGKEADSCILEY